MDQNSADGKQKHEPQFHPVLSVLFSTDVRRGGLLGIKWQDVDFERTWRRLRQPHSIREEEVDLSFADFASENIAKRLYSSPTIEGKCAT
jgi:hypothetical protein